MPFTPPGEYPYINDSAPGEGDGDIVYAEIVNVIMAYLQDVLPIDISEASAADIYHAVLLGRDAPESHPADAIVVDASGFAGNLDGTITNAQLLAAAVDDLTTGGGGGGAVDSVDGRTGVVTLDDLYQTVGVEIATVDTTLAGPPRTVITAIVDGTVTLPTAGVGDVGQHWHISTGPYELTVVGCDGGDVTVPVGMVLSVVGFEGPGPVYGWAQLGFKTIDAPTSGGGGVTGDSELVATSTTLTGPPHTVAVAAAGSIDITVTLPDATAGDKGLVWYIRNLNSDSVVYVANLAEGDETITESKGLLVAGIELDTPGTYAWMKVGFVSETGTSSLDELQVALVAQVFGG